MINTKNARNKSNNLLKNILYIVCVYKFLANLAGLPITTWLS